MRPSLRLCLVAVLAASAASCALPGRMEGGSANAPKPLSDDLMQSGEQVGWQPRPRDKVLGCVVIKYDIERNGKASNVEIVEAQPPGYFEQEVLNLMPVMSFKPRKQVEHATRTFTFIPKDSNASREAAASLCASSVSLPPPN